MSETPTSPKEISIERFYSLKMGDSFLGLVPAPVPLSKGQLRNLRAVINQEIYEEKGEDTESILGAVCDRFQISRAMLFRRTQAMRTVWPRQLAMFLIYETDDFSLNEVGAIFKKDHGTVLHAISAVKGRIETDGRSARDLAAIREMLSTQTGDATKETA